jgi:hypothetical protein
MIKVGGGWRGICMEARAQNFCPSENKILCSTVFCPSTRQAAPPIAALSPPPRR